MGEANESFLQTARLAGLRPFRLRLFIIFAAAFLSMTVASVRPRICRT